MNYKYLGTDCWLYSLYLNEKRKNMIKFKLEEGAVLPEYQTKLASGFDVVAHSILKVFKGDTEITGEKLEKVVQGFNERGYIKLRPFERIMFSTGLVLGDIHESLEIQVRSRSGLSLKRGLVVINSPGTIDADYRGICGVILYNSTPFLSKVDKGERIAQFVPTLSCRVSISETEIPTPSERGENGFGSTGK